MRRKLTIGEMREIAGERGGECLSEEYVNCSTKLRWRCKEGHEWEATPASIKQGSWCPYCAGLARLTIEEMKQIARKRGRKCLSKEYVNSHTKLKWRCTKGHVWETTYSTVQKGHWCPYCAGNARLTIEEMREIAEQRGGECLSTKYVNANTKLRWRCKEGHEWDAVPHTITQGHWCPYCAGKKRE